MLISLNWLRELVELPEDVGPQQIADRLTLAGLEVEAIEDLSAQYEGIVVGLIEKVEKIPDTKNLKLCAVSDGTDSLQVVCGAPNAVVGGLVPFAQIGAKLPGLEIKKTTIRGVESNGMLCSEKELGISDDHAGLMLLEAGEPGQPIAAVLRRDDVVLEIGVTPNRPDALSHIGVAREVIALLDGRPRGATPTCAERGGPVEDRATVTIADVEACPRYGCRVIDNVQVQASPLWLKARLEAVGIRSINNIVDVTNFVMMERGIPLHAFDYDKLAGERERVAITVRKATGGERLKTLDGQERVLVEDDLVIADAEKPIALAGVMGGANSEVAAETTRILLEGAHFAPSTVRRTARRLGIHSEASHRFERGCDPNGVRQSLDRAAALIAELTGGQVARGVVDAYPKKIEKREVALRFQKASDLLGVPVDERTCSALLLSIGLEVGGREGEGVRFRVPTYRPDLLREVDLIEEIARLIGYDKIEATLPARTGVSRGMVDERRLSVEDGARSALEASGFNEAINFAFVSPEHAALFAPESELVRLQNPLGEEMSVLRPSLIPGLLQSAVRNLRRGETGVRLYEVATVFRGKNPEGAQARIDDEDGPIGGDAWARESARVSLVIAGAHPARAFDTPARPFDIYDATGAVESVLAHLGFAIGYVFDEVSIAPADEPSWLHPRARATLSVAGAACGVVGEIHPALREAFDAPSLFVAELDTRALTARAGTVPKAQRPPRFPAVRRDLALLVDDKVDAAEIARALAGRREVEPYVESVDVFDVYRGEHVPAGKKSLALAITLRAADRTLTDDEVNEVAEALIAEARDRFSAEVRS